jgi:hypothetical protein
MSRQRYFGPFSGLQLTAIIITLTVVIGVPSTVYAIDTFSNVAVEDPVTGVKASVDTLHRLRTIDTVTGNVLAQETTPANIVRFFGGGLTCTGLYTVPAGKALILKTADGYVFKSTSDSYGELDLYADSSCSSFVAAFLSDHAANTVTENFGPGIAFRAGATVSLASSRGSGTVHGFGYLVPASAVPAGAPTAADAKRRNAAPDVSQVQGR